MFSKFDKLWSRNGWERLASFCPTPKFSHWETLPALPHGRYITDSRHVLCSGTSLQSRTTECGPSSLGFAMHLVGDWMIPVAANATATLQRILSMLLNGLHNSQKLLFPSGGSTPPSNTWFLGLTWVFIQNGMSIGSAVFAHRTVKCPIALHQAATFSP